MRPLRFRAWHMKSRTMTTGLDFCRVIANFHGLHDKEWSELIWMQSTGFNDYNDNEIFEGDILKTKYLDDEEKDKCTKIVVVWDPNIAGFVGIGMAHYGDGLNSHNDISTTEIIGNIFKNPKLAKRIQ